MLLAGLIGWRIIVLTFSMTKIANNKLAREKAEKIGKKPTQYKTSYTVVADVVGWFE